MKKSKPHSFKAKFTAGCVKGTCQGWKTKGTYYTQTSAEGFNQLRMRVLIKAPFKFFKISQYDNTASLVVSTSENLVEVFNCQWKRGVSKGYCLNSIGKKSLLEWYRGNYENSDLVKMGIWT